MWSTETFFSHPVKNDPPGYVVISGGRRHGSQEEIGHLAGALCCQIVSSKDFWESDD